MDSIGVQLVTEEEEEEEEEPPAPTIVEGGAPSSGTRPTTGSGIAPAAPALAGDEVEDQHHVEDEDHVEQGVHPVAAPAATQTPSSSSTQEDPPVQEPHVPSGGETLAEKATYCVPCEPHSPNPTQEEPASCVGLGECAICMQDLAVAPQLSDARLAPSMQEFAESLTV